jgi:DedD protein
MEKEMKKLLLVAVSVGIFLLVTVIAAIVLVTPKVQTQETAFTSSTPVTINRIVPVELEVPVINPVEIVSIVSEERPIDVNDGGKVTIKVNKPASVAVPETPEPKAKPAVTVQQKEVKPAASKPVAAAKPVQTKPTQTKPVQTKPAPTKKMNDYWVQTGAFIEKIRAEDAKDKLASKGIVSIIDNRELNGKIWYRVRLGPYTSEKEADYWLRLVKAIDGFTQSEIRQTAVN